MAHLREEDNFAASLTSSDIDYRLLPAHSQIPHGGGHESPSSIRQQSLEHDTSPLGYFHAVLLENAPQPKTGFAQRFYAQLKGLFPKSVFPESWSTWRTGVIICAFAAAISFLLNTSVGIWAITHFGIDKGIGTIYHGSCKKTENMSWWFHVGINILATILLSASNYCMQCLVAPTREDINCAHHRGLWADIGVPSMRNFRIIGPGRVVLWCCLALSSGPLHLMYNSAIFSSLANNDYSVTVVAQDGLSLFLDGGYQNYTDGDPNRYQNLTKINCMKDYGVPFLSARSDVIVIVDAPRNSTNSTTLDYIVGNIDFITLTDAGYQAGVDYSWICGTRYSYSRCNIKTALAQVESWNMNGYPVQFCLSEVDPVEKCSLQFSRTILIVVIICNAVKCICMVLAALNLKQRPLITIGDAISSFLKTPDPATSGMWITTKKDFQKIEWASARAGHAHEAPFRTWYPYGHRWFRAASVTRWLICTLVALSGMSIIIRLLSVALPELQADFDTPDGLRSLWDIGFGTVDYRTLLNVAGSNNPYGNLIACVLLANIAQLMMSTLYLLYNSIFTSMVLADEWDRMSSEPKTLRVTQPTGEQRSSYFLTLPYKYSIPLVVASGGIHWLISQSIFLTSIISYKGSQPTPDESITTIGYSPIAIICSLASGGVLLLVVLANGFRRYNGRIPLVGSCSAAISAACHPGPEGPVNKNSVLQWKLVESDGDVGHCTSKADDQFHRESQETRTYEQDQESSA